MLISCVKLILHLREYECTILHVGIGMELCLLDSHRESQARLEHRESPEIQVQRVLKDQPDLKDPKD